MSRVRTALSRQAYSVGALLAVITVVPLLGAAWFATQAVTAARADREVADRVEHDVGDLVWLAELQTRLLDERNWTVSVRGIQELGLSSEFVEVITGVAVEEEAAQAAERSDELIGRLGLGDIRRDLDEIRSAQVELVTLGERYAELELRVSEEASARSGQTLTAAAGVGGDSAIVARLQALEAATRARRALAIEFKLYFDAKFMMPDQQLNNLNALAGEHQVREVAVSDLERLVEPTSQAAASLEALRGSTDEARFDAAMEEVLNDRTLADTTAGLELVLTDYARVSEVLDASTSVGEQYLDLVRLTGADVQLAATTASAAAQQRERNAQLALAGLGLLTVAVAGVATRLLARPIRRLANAARTLGYAPLADFAVDAGRGPREVREASGALIDAAIHLEIAERQALALADGDLSHEALNEAGPGQLGESLQAAVGTLAESMREREELRRSLEHEASHDALTGLSNRAGILRDLAAMTGTGATSNRRLCVMFIDLDGFKQINDRHGHHAGDVTLQTVADNLAVTVRVGDRLARFGGDEFIVVAEVADEEEAVVLGQRLGRAVATPIDLGDAMVGVTASIGVVLEDPSEAVVGELLRDADMAAYVAKRSGKNRVEVCDDAMRVEMRGRSDVEADLYRAIVDEELVLHYQPIVDRRTEDVTGYEALVRWQPPGAKLVYPDAFIETAEGSDLIMAIDRWVIEEAVRQQALWIAADPCMGRSMHVNVSGRHLSNPGFVDDVARPLRRHGVPPSRLVVEITENGLLEDIDRAAANLRELRELGVRIAIDDFGTGFSSLTHLRELPIDILKIDRTFVNDLSVASLVRLVIETGHLLGVTVIAEGIETRHAAERLAAMGVDEFQGYFYGQPGLPELAVSTAASAVGFTCPPARESS